MVYFLDMLHYIEHIASCLIFSHYFDFCHYYNIHFSALYYRQAYFGRGFKQFSAQGNGPSIASTPQGFPMNLCCPLTLLPSLISAVWLTAPRSVKAKYISINNISRRRQSASRLSPLSDLMSDIRLPFLLPLIFRVYAAPCKNTPLRWYIYSIAFRVIITHDSLRQIYWYVFAWYFPFILRLDYYCTHRH